MPEWHILGDLPLTFALYKGLIVTMVVFENGYERKLGVNIQISPFTSLMFYRAIMYESV